MDKRKILLVFWLVGMLVPLNWVERLVYAFRRGVRILAGSEPAHVVGHLILFSGLVILLLYLFQLPLSRRTAVLLVMMVLVVGLGQEFLQLQVKNRSFSWPEVFDLGVDLTGGVLGWLAYRYYLRYGRYLRIAYFILRDV
jgi:hypothetical protein